VKDKLESFVINNLQLEQLEDSLATFNIFKILGLEHYELRHSNTLSYLFNPIESHGLNDYFLKKYLISVISNSDNSIISPIIIDGWNLKDANVKREYKDIDILISSKTNSFVCCIENKVLSSESNDQLQRYHYVVNEEFRNYKYKIFIFLSPTGVEPSDNENWIISTYEQVSNIIEHIINYKSKDLGREQLTFIEHYYKIIRRHLMENSEEVKLAREIYNSHKDALDFIFQNISDNRQDIFNQVKNIVENNSEFVLLYSTMSRIRFTTKYMNDNLPNIGNKRWNGMIQVFAYEVINNIDSISLILVMGPADALYREKAFTKLKADFIPKYLKTKTSLSEMYNTIYKKVLISKDEYNAMDIASIQERIKNIISSDNNDFNDIDEYFKNNIEFFKEQN
jgi:hypothetical protein